MDKKLDVTSVAYQIEFIRQNRGWTQKILAEKAGMAPNRVSLLEKSEYDNVTITTLKRIASAFDVALSISFVPFSTPVKKDEFSDGTNKKPDEFIKHDIASEFCLRGDGLYYNSYYGGTTDEKRWIWICPPISVVSDKSEASSEINWEDYGNGTIDHKLLLNIWCKRVKFRDCATVKNVIDIPWELFAGDFTEVFKILLRYGFQVPVSRNGREMLIRYIWNK
jgi:transcriptional regulator with XRE-family HTH domain